MRPDEPVHSAPRSGGLPIDGSARVLVLTGAGISADSGLTTFRGSHGLWEGHRVEDVATPEGFERDPELVWRFYSDRRAAADAASPNAAHLALVSLERRLGDRFLLATQNVDGLHARAGSRRILEVHGSLWRTRCSLCDAEAFRDERYPVRPPIPTCRNCGGLLRPAIVWFGEMLDSGGERRIGEFIGDARRAGERLVFLAVGTSGSVYPAAGYARIAKSHGAGTWLVNLEAPANATDFDHILLGRAAVVLPPLIDGPSRSLRDSTASTPAGADTMAP